MLVTVNCLVVHGKGETALAGATVVLSDDVAADLIQRGYAVEAPTPPPDPKPARSGKRSAL